MANQIRPMHLHASSAALDIVFQPHCRQQYGTPESLKRHKRNAVAIMHDRKRRLVRTVSASGSALRSVDSLAFGATIDDYDLLMLNGFLFNTCSYNRPSRAT